MEKTKSGHWYRECWRWDTLGFQLHLIWRMWYGACYVDIGRWERGLGKVTALIPGCSCSYCYSSCNDPFWLAWSSNSDVYNFRPKSSSGIPPWLCSITEPQKALSWAVSSYRGPGYISILFECSWLNSFSPFSSWLWHRCWLSGLEGNLEHHHPMLNSVSTRLISWHSVIFSRLHFCTSSSSLKVREFIPYPELYPGNWSGNRFPDSLVYY